MDYHSKKPSPKRGGEMSFIYIPNYHSIYKNSSELKNMPNFQIFLC